MKINLVKILLGSLFSFLPKGKRLSTVYMLRLFITTGRYGSKVPD